MPKLFRIRKNDEGAVAVEFAFVLIPLIYFTFGIIEFSLIMFASSVIEGATANAARLSKTGQFASESPTDAVAEDTAQVRQFILNRGVGVLESEKLTVIITPDATETGTVGDAGEVVVYQANYEWEIFTPFLGELLSNDINNRSFHITSRAVVVNEPWE